MNCSLFDKRAINKFNSCNNRSILIISILSAFRIIFRNIFHFILQVLLLLFVLFIVLNLVTFFSTESLAEQIKAMVHSQPIDEFWTCSRSLVKDFPLHFKNEEAEHQPLFLCSPRPIVRIIHPALFSNHPQECLL